MFTNKKWITTLVVVVVSLGMLQVDLHAAENNKLDEARAKANDLYAQVKEAKKQLEKSNPEYAQSIKAKEKAYHAYTSRRKEIESNMPGLQKVKDELKALKKSRSELVKTKKKGSELRKVDKKIKTIQKQYSKLASKVSVKCKSEKKATLLADNMINSFKKEMYKIAPELTRLQKQLDQARAKCSSLQKK